MGRWPSAALTQAAVTGAATDPTTGDTGLSVGTSGR
jgi:hypothetical protein